jgi:hypothetical protein
VPEMTVGSAALVGLIDRYLGGLLDLFVTPLEVQKLMYFMQEAGEPLQLKYLKAPYGPYAENLRHVLRAVEGHLIVGYADGGDKPDKPLSLVPGAIQDAAEFLRQHRESKARFDHVTRLVEGFESPFGLELLATVHWVMNRECVSQIADLADHVCGWSPRKRQFMLRQLEVASGRLASQGRLQ